MPTQVPTAIPTSLPTVYEKFQQAFGPQVNFLLGLAEQTEESIAANIDYYKASVAQAAATAVEEYGQTIGISTANTASFPTDHVDFVLVSSARRYWRSLTTGATAEVSINGTNNP